MKPRKLLGYSLIATPFIAIFAFIMIFHGPLAVIFTLGTTTLTVACIYFGTNLTQ